VLEAVLGWNPDLYMVVVSGLEIVEKTFFFLKKDLVFFKKKATNLLCFSNVWRIFFIKCASTTSYIRSVLTQSFNPDI